MEEKESWKKDLQIFKEKHSRIFDNIEDMPLGTQIICEFIEGELKEAVQ